jgi:hypothetical protein
MPITSHGLSSACIDGSFRVEQDLGREVEPSLNRCNLDTPQRATDLIGPPGSDVVATQLCMSGGKSGLTVVGGASAWRFPRPRMEENVLHVLSGRILNSG